jgi:multimeric flavodoxin WrbA
MAAGGKKKDFIMFCFSYHFMKILGIATSPRKGANSQTLVEHILAGAKDAGAKTELVRICDLDIGPCTGCGVCQTGEACVIDDDMEGLWEKMTNADAIVLGSPVYWNRLNAQAYPFIDRFYAHFKDFSCDLPKGKKIVFALTCGGVGPDVLNSINTYVKNVFQFLGCIDAGFIWQNNCLLPKDLAKYPEKIKEAKQLGKSLVK